MSTTVEPKSSKYVDYDEFVDYRLQKTRSEIKWTEILTTLVGIFALTLSYLFVFTILDHWVIDGGFSRGTRTICLLGLAAVSVAWIVWKIVLPMWKEVHGLYAARMIEEHVPELKSNLLNLIDLQRSGRAANPGIMGALEKRSAVELSHVDMDHVIDRRQLLRISYFLLAVVVLFCLYALLSPKPISFLRPLTVANIPVATQTRIVEVTPGDVTVLARRPVHVKVTVSDKQPDEVLFHYTTRDQSFVDERLEMTPTPEKEGEYQLLFAGENGDGIGQQIEYFITAGDARSEQFTIGVQTAPIAEIERIDYRYPDYMQLDPRSQFVGAIDAWEGTEVRLEARITNHIPIKSAMLQFIDRGQQNGPVEEIPLTVLEGERITGKWKLNFREDGTYAREYRIVCTSKEGLKDPSPPTYPLTIRPDEAPEVALLDPTGDLEKPANAVIPLIFKARDPDFQMRYVTLRAEKDGKELQSYLIFDGEQKAVADRYRWELKPLGLQPGDVVSFFLEARDNKQPFGNRRTTQPLNLTIIAPAEQEQIEEQLQQDEADQEPQLQEEQRHAAEENGEEGGESASAENGTEDGEENHGELAGDQPEDDETGDDENKDESPEEGNQENQQDKDGEKSESEKVAGESSRPSEEGNDRSESPSEGDNDAAGEPSDAYKNDGTDDAEVLDKIVKDQQQDPEPDESPPPEEQTDQDQNADPNAESGQDQGEQKQDQGTGSGEEQPDNTTNNDSPAQPGTGEGTPKDDMPQNSEKPANAGETPNDGNRENTTDEGPAEKRPGNPDTKGEGTPDENPDADTPRANDPKNIERKPGTEPSTVPSQDPKPSPDSPKDNTSQNPDQKPKPGAGEKKPSNPSAPNQPEGVDRPDPGDADPNQRSKKPDTGEDGSGQQTTDGTRGEQGKGDADPTDKPGETAENPDGDGSGKPGQKNDQGQQQGEGQAQDGGNTPSDQPGEGETSSTQPAEGEASESQGSGSASNPGSTSSKGRPGTQNSGNQPGPNSEGTGAGQTPTTSREEQNLDHAKQAADLVLKRLENDLERGEVNEELLEELGWTEDEMKSFADRMRRQLEKDSSQLSDEERVKQRQFEEMLRNMNFDPNRESVSRKNATSKRPTRSISGGQRTVPLELRDAFEEFTRTINRQK